MQATQPADRERILSAIAASIGATELNLQLKRALVDSAVYESSHTAATGAELAAVQNKAATMLQVKIGLCIGDCLHSYMDTLVENLAQRQLTVPSRLCRPTASLLHRCRSFNSFEAPAMLHPSAELMSTFRPMLQANGEFDAALPLFRDALAGREAALGATAADSLTSLNNLAGDYTFTIFMQPLNFSNRSKAGEGKRSVMFCRALLLLGWDGAAV